MSKRKNNRSLSESECDGYYKSTNPSVCFVKGADTWNIRCRYRTSVKIKYSDYQSGGYPTQELAESEVNVLRDCLEFKPKDFWIPYLKRQPPGSSLSNEFKP